LHLLQKGSRVACFPHTAVHIEDEGVSSPPVHLNQMRAIPGDLRWLVLVVPVTETELTLFIASKSPKVPLEGDDERVIAQRHDEEWEVRKCENFQKGTKIRSSRIYWTNSIQSSWFKSLCARVGRFDIECEASSIHTYINELRVVEDMAGSKKVHMATGKIHWGVHPWATTVGNRSSSLFFVLTPPECVKESFIY
jgi:hypothetical protein